MNDKKAMRVEEDGFSAVFTELGTQRILRGRLGAKGEERILRLGGRLVRYKTNEFGAPLEPLQELPI